MYEQIRLIETPSNILSPCAGINESPISDNPDSLNSVKNVFVLG